MADDMVAGDLPIFAVGARPSGGPSRTGVLSPPMRAMWAFVATTLVLSSGCTKQDWIDRTLVTVDVTGTWLGDIEGTAGGSRELSLELEQQGSTVKGFIRMTGGGANP